MNDRWEPTAELRYIQRGDKLVLQQRWQTVEDYTARPLIEQIGRDYKMEWRDVPLVDLRPAVASKEHLNASVAK